MHSSREYEDAIAAADIDGRVASLSVHLVIEAQKHETGWPNLSGKIVTPALYGYSPDSQCEARLVAADVYAAWEKAGRPHVDVRCCKDAYRYLLACVTSGLIDPLPSINAIDLPKAPAPTNYGKRKYPPSHVHMQQLFEQEIQ